MSHRSFTATSALLFPESELHNNFDTSDKLLLHDHKSEHRCCGGARARAQEPLASSSRGSRSFSLEPQPPQPLRCRFSVFWKSYCKRRRGAGYSALFKKTAD
ncbi:hypothetical protein GN956_G5826 [Arapaima gigas]